MTASASIPHEWDRITSMMPLSTPHTREPQGALIPDAKAQRDQIAVVYNKGDTPPRITVAEVSHAVQAVMANGVAVAMVARADGPTLKAEDVLLVERSDGARR